MVDFLREGISGIDGVSKPEDSTTDPDAGEFSAADPEVSRMMDGKGGDINVQRRYLRSCIHPLIPARFVLPSSSVMILEKRAVSMIKATREPPRLDAA
ncbi:MAG: hypothetical protein Q9219_003870 [cf. Caloplaca sp. 3 TL-2023]